MLTTLKDCENPVKHLVETAGKVRCQKSQHKIPVLLKQRIFMPVASVGPADQFGSSGSNAIAPTVG